MKMHSKTMKKPLKKKKIKTGVKGLLDLFTMIFL